MPQGDEQVRQGGLERLEAEYGRHVDSLISQERIFTIILLDSGEDLPPLVRSALSQLTVPGWLPHRKLLLEACEKKGEPLAHQPASWEWMKSVIWAALRNQLIETVKHLGSQEERRLAVSAHRLVVGRKVRDGELIQL